MTNYIEFIKWCFKDVSIRSTRAFIWIFGGILASFIYGPMALYIGLLIFFIDLTCIIVYERYLDFLKDTNRTDD